MSHLLSVRAKCGRLQATANGGKSSGYNTELSLRVGDVEHVTSFLTGTNPAWNQEFFFEVHSPKEELELTLQSKGWFSKRDVLGTCAVMLFDVPFGEQGGDGCWFELTQRTAADSAGTGHQILLHLHYDPEPGISPREAERSWKIEYVRSGGTEPVDIGSVVSEDGCYDVDDESEEEEDEDDDVLYTDESGEYASEDRDELGEDVNAVGRGVESMSLQPGGESVAGGTRPIAVTTSLPVNMMAGSDRRSGGKGNQPSKSSLQEPHGVESSAHDGDFDGHHRRLDSSADDDPSAVKVSRGSAGGRSAKENARAASWKRRHSGDKMKLGMSRRQGKMSARQGSTSSQQQHMLDADADTSPVLRARSSAISEGSPNPTAGYLSSDQQLSPRQSLDEMDASPGTSLSVRTDRKSKAVSTSEVTIAIEPALEDHEEEAGEGSGIKPGRQSLRHWHQAIGTVLDTASRSRKNTLAQVATDASTYGKMFEFHMEPSLKLDSRKSFVTKNASAQAAIKRRLALLGRRNVLLCNEQLQIHVYHKTIQALLYPLSDNKEHDMLKKTFKKPTHCYECGSLLWGLANQGFKCGDCGISCHKRCLELLNADCLQRAAERYAKEGDEGKTGYFRRMMEHKIVRRQQENSEIFECIRQVFNVPKRQHESDMVVAKQNILEGMAVWSAKVKVSVIEAQGLCAKDKATGCSDPYVTVQVGSKKVKTEVVLQNLNPKWNQTFDFECHESSDRIKVRVWDEDRDLKAAIANALTKEPDDFLGQTIVEVYSLSGEMDVWYTLDRRSDRSAVSGAIHLRIIVEVKGEEKRAPFHIQYTSLHETMFDYIDQLGDNVQMTSFTQAQDRSLLFFKRPSQDIIQEFALRYGIENIYQIMTHFSCLSMRYATPGMPAVLGKLLVLINGYFRDHATSVQISDGATMSGKGRFLASNFKKEKFEEVLDRLQEYLLLDLKSYRDVFPAEQEEKLNDLRAAIDLLTSIMFFRQKVLNSGSALKGRSLVRECIEASIISTFNHFRTETMAFIAEGNVTESMAVAAATADTTIAKKIGMEDGKPPAEKLVNPLTYAFRLIDLIAQLVEQDRDIYSKYILQFRDLNMGELSAMTLWELLLEDLNYQLALPEVELECATAIFMNLMFKVKWFFDKHVAKVPGMAEKSKDYHMLFAKYVRAWLNETVEKFDDILRKALLKDEGEKFKPMSEHNMHSWSVVDIFTAMTECHTVLQSAGCTVAELQGEYDMLFASLAVRVLTKYTAFLKNIFASRTPPVDEACILLNNAEQLRVRLEILYKKMGGELIEGTDAGLALHDLQAVLKNDLDELCVRLAQGLEDSIRKRTGSISTLLHKLKSASPPSESETHALIEPVFEVIFERIQALLTHCNKTIVRRILKELYRMILTHLLRNVILPPLSTVRALGRDHDGMELTHIQCQALSMCLKAMQVFFFGDSRGLKKSFMNECAEKRRVDAALEMFSSSTDALIGNFISAELEQDKLGLEDQVGEISVQVDIFETQSEQKVTVKVVSASRLQWPMSVSGFRPFVEITLFGPALAGVRRRQETKSKTKNPPAYNETFSYPLSKMCDITVYELHFTVRDYCFGRSKPLVGLTTLPLRTVHSASGSLMARLSLGRTLSFSEFGEDVLCVLSQRPQDEIANEFVSLKLEARTVDLP